MTFTRFVPVLLAMLALGQGALGSPGVDAAASMRNALVESTWSLNVKLGRVSIETRSLTFCADGTLRERIADDTGLHDAKGTWNLKASEGGLVLELTGAGIRDRGRYGITELPKERAIELRLVDSQRVLRFERGTRETASACDVANATPLVIGETFTIDSKILGETRRINVCPPPGYAGSPDSSFPVLYMPDGGMAEDFLHVAGLVQVSVGNGTMRPFLLVGIENTERRRDMTGPTKNEEDKKIAPRVGGSEAFRRFIRDELMPQVKSRYRTTNETAIVGESLAGLFVVETFLLAPEMFDTFIAIDPSLWWNDRGLVTGAVERLAANANAAKTLYLATGDEKEIVADATRFADVLRDNAPASIRWHHERMPEEKHSTIYHPAALRAFRTVFQPVPGN